MGKTLSKVEAQRKALQLQIKQFATSRSKVKKKVAILPKQKQLLTVAHIGTTATPLQKAVNQLLNKQTISSS